jgi:hypothetical protein
MASEDDVRQVLLQAIHTAARAPQQSPANLLRLAEAYAWILMPGASHGSSSNSND